jgi:imidazolonepropionase-like amidohydrolase
MHRRIAATLLLLASLLGARTTYILAGKIFDGQQLLDRRIVVVRYGLIQAVLPGDTPIPDTVDKIDARDQTVLPGFIDSHIHFMADPQLCVNDVEKYGSGRSEAEWMSLFPKNRSDLLRAGVTEVIDMGATLGNYLGMRAALRKRTITGPEVYFPGPLFAAAIPSSPNSFLPAYTGQHDLIDNGLFRANRPEPARRKVASLATAGVDFIGLVDDQSQRRARLRPEVIEAAVDEAHRQGLRVFALVDSEPEAWAMVSAGVDGIEYGFSLTSDRLLLEMAARRVFFTPVLGVSAQVALPIQQTVKRAYQLGVPLCVGTGFPASGGASCGEDIFRELAMFEELGIPRLEALKALTRNAAAKIGKERELGMVATGYRANLVFAAGDIMSGTLTAARIVRVMLHGETVVEDRRIAPARVKGFRESSLSVFGFPYWDPLLSWLVGGNITDYDLFRTGVTASVDVVASIRNMWLTNVNLGLPSPIPRTALKVGAHFDDQNRLFYGIGNDARLEDTLEYANLIFKESFSATTRITPELKANATLFFDQSKLTPYRYGPLPDSVPGYQGGNEAIASVTLSLDTRDNINNPWYGHYIALTGQLAPAILPGGHSFEKVMIDIRGYLSLWHKHILAGRLLYQQAFGDAPFYYYPDFGGDTLGRGYLPNRLRDRAGLYAQLEYRFPIVGSLSGVVFSDIGRLQSSLSQFTATGFHPTIGFGPRLSTGSNETSIIGVDAGFTREGWNLVLHAGHAF